MIENCTCKVKVPAIEIEFLKDQRGERKLFIDSRVDKTTTEKMSESRKRKEKDLARLQKTSHSVPSSSSAPANLQSSSGTESTTATGTDIDSDFNSSDYTFVSCFIKGKSANRSSDL